MKKNLSAKLILALLTIFIISPSNAQEDDINILSLDDVIYIAQEQSPDALIAKHRVQVELLAVPALQGRLFAGINPGWNNSNL